MTDIIKDGTSWPTVEEYVKREIAHYHVLLETADANQHKHHQGSIFALRALLEEAEKPALFAAARAG